MQVAFGSVDVPPLSADTWSVVLLPAPSAGWPEPSEIHIRGEQFQEKPHVGLATNLKTKQWVILLYKHPLATLKKQFIIGITACLINVTCN